MKIFIYLFFYLKTTLYTLLSTVIDLPFTCSRTELITLFIYLTFINTHIIHPLREYTQYYRDKSLQWWYCIYRWEFRIGLNIIYAYHRMLLQEYKAGKFLLAWKNRWRLWCLKYHACKPVMKLVGLLKCWCLFVAKRCQTVLWHHKAWLYLIALVNKQHNKCDRASQYRRVVRFLFGDKQSLKSRET